MVIVIVHDTSPHAMFRKSAIGPFVDLNDARRWMRYNDKKWPRTDGMRTYETVGIVPAYRAAGYDEWPIDG